MKLNWIPGSWKFLQIFNIKVIINAAKIKSSSLKVLLHQWRFTLWFNSAWVRSWSVTKHCKAFVVFEHVRPWKLMLRCQWRGNSRWTPAEHVHVAIVPCNSWQQRRASQLMFTQSQHGDNNRRICASLTGAYPNDSYPFLFGFILFSVRFWKVGNTGNSACNQNVWWPILLRDLLVFGPTL